MDEVEQEPTFITLMYMQGQFATPEKQIITGKGGLIKLEAFLEKNSYECLVAPEGFTAGFCVAAYYSDENEAAPYIVELYFNAPKGRGHVYLIITFDFGDMLELICKGANILSVVSGGGVSVEVVKR